MIAQTITVRNILRFSLKSKSIVFDTHTYTEKTSKKDVKRRSIVFKTFSPIINKSELIDFINSEFTKYGYSNKAYITRQSYSPYEYIRVISSI